MPFCGLCLAGCVAPLGQREAEIRANRVVAEFLPGQALAARPVWSRARKSKIAGWWILKPRPAFTPWRWITAATPRSASGTKTRRADVFHFFPLWRLAARLAARSFPEISCRVLPGFLRVFALLLATPVLAAGTIDGWSGYKFGMSPDAARAVPGRAIRALLAPKFDERECRRHGGEKPGAGEWPGLPVGSVVRCRAEAEPRLSGKPGQCAAPGL